MPRSWIAKGVPSLAVPCQLAVLEYALSPAPVSVPSHHPFGGAWLPTRRPALCFGGLEVSIRPLFPSHTSNSSHSTPQSQFCFPSQPHPATEPTILATTSGLKISLRNLSFCKSSRFFSVGPGYIKNLMYGGWRKYCKYAR